MAAKERIELKNIPVGLLVSGSMDLGKEQELEVQNVTSSGGGMG